jgi:glycosidase
VEIPTWVRDAVFYQVFPERFKNGNAANDPPGTAAWGDLPTRDNFFGGDLDGVIQGLDYIADLGCNAIYLTPIFKAATNHKYDIYDYFQIDPAFGDDATFDRLIVEAHHRGIRVVLDGVFNHCGTGFAPFQDLLLNGERSKYKDWFMPYGFPLQQEPPNYATCGGVGWLPRLNTRNSQVESFVRRVVLHWLGRGVDGWRMDVPYEIETDFWRRLRPVVKHQYPDAYLVAEEWRDPWPLLQGDSFDGAMHYRLRDLLFDFFLKNALAADSFARALSLLRERMPQDAEAGMLTLLGSHDTARVLTECGGDERQAKLLFTFLLTYPGVPMIYYGDENGMEGYNDPDCRRPMVWAADQWNLELRTQVKCLLRLRRENPVLRSGVFSFNHAEDRVFSFVRALDGEQVLVVLNNSRVERSLELPVALPEGTELVDALSEVRFRVQRGRVSWISMEPKRAWVLYESYRYSQPDHC